MKKKLSIIIPVYNGAKYINRCIDSILNQNIYIDEIIIINDNSSDGTKEVLEKCYARKENIIIINLESNQGVSYCRNLGIKIAKGEYIGFIDADDYIEVDMYEKLYNKAKLNNLDISICKFIEVDGNSRIRSKYQSNYEILERDISIKYYLKNKISPSVWDKIFNYKLLENIKFNDELKIGEDILFCLEAIYNSKRIGFVDEYLYNYIQNENSAVHSLSSKLLQYKEVIKYIPSEIKKNLECNYCNEFNTFSNSLNLRIIHTVSKLYNKNTKNQVFEYISGIDKYNLKSIIRDKNLSAYARIEAVVILICGIKFHILLQPLYIKIRKLKNR